MLKRILHAWFDLYQRVVFFQLLLVLSPTSTNKLSKNSGIRFQKKNKDVLINDKV